MLRALVALAVCLLLATAAEAGTEVTLETMLGDVTLELYDDVAPATSRNLEEPTIRMSGSAASPKRSSLAMTSMVTA